MELRFVEAIALGIVVGEMMRIAESVMRQCVFQDSWDLWLHYNIRMMTDFPKDEEYEQ